MVPRISRATRRRVDDRQREGRQDVRLREAGLHAEQRQDAQLQGEGVLQQQADHEGREADGQRRQQGDEHVPEAVAVDRRDQSGQDADEDVDHHRGERQLGRVDQLGPQDLVDRAPLPVVLAQVPWTVRPR
jgi:hypothetical protein